MSDRSLHFEAVEVRRALGIRHGDGFELSGLSHGVNLVHGPNGSGKSTTALVIQELLWPKRTGLERPTVTGRFRDSETDWRVDIDAGEVDTARGGESGIVPDFGLPENRHRYHLALHELISADNSDFAKAIADASQGGYDLEAAAQALNFKERPSSPRNKSAHLRETWKAVREAGRRLRDLDQNAAQLPDILKQRDRAIAANDNIELLQNAKKHCEAEDEYQRLKLELDTLPEGIAKLHGDEREKLDQIAKQHKQLQENLQAELEKLAGAQQELDEVKLPEEGIEKELLSRLRADQARLKDVETDLRQRHQQVAQADTEEKKARERLREHLTEEQLVSMDIVEIGEMSTFARKAERLRARLVVHEERRGWLDQEEPEEVRGIDAQQIQEGITALGHWLASPPPAMKPAKILWWPIVASVVLIASLGVVLALVHHWAWILAVLAAVGVMVWHWWLRRSTVDANAADPRTVHRESYEATGLQPPEEWKAPVVSELIRDLVRLAGIRAHEDERIRRAVDLQHAVETLDRDQSELDREREELEDRLGLRIDVADEWLPLLVDNISSWQQCNDEAAGARHCVVNLEQEEETLLNKIRAAVRPFGYGEIESAESARQSIEDLADRQSLHRQANSERNDAERRIEEQIKPGLQDLSDQRLKIFERLGLEESEESRIDDWLADRKNYLDLNKDLAKAAAIRDEHRKALAGNEDLLELDAIDIKGRIDEQQTTADERDDLTTQIADIERDIKEAKAGHDLSDALAAYDLAEGELAEVREQNGRAVVGNLLTQWVRTVAIERSRPQVFRRANELAAQFTQGTLQLELDDNATPPAFSAHRGSEPRRPLNQLSVGERVQMLVAVRMAFLEQDERTRLPLLLDEALGTSDDGRAGLIIDTIIELAREGRQVFYFTAQHDEVGKWATRLKESGVQHEVFDLAQIRQLSASAAAPLQIATIDAPQPPAPDGMSHYEYGRTLGVPNINPAVENLDGLHLWHLIEDVDLLHQLLCRGITSWGQLRTLLEQGGVGLVDADEAQFDRASAAAKAIEAACRTWRVGRGKPVDRYALQDSDCVTDRYIGEVAGVAQRVGGSAEATISALERREVSGWQNKNTVKLREFFEENGFLSSEDPLQTEEIRLRVVATVADDLREGRLEVSSVDRIVGSLPVSDTER